MKKIILMIVFLLICSSCNNETKNNQVISTDIEIVEESGISSQEGNLVVQQQPTKQETISVNKETESSQKNNPSAVKKEDHNKGNSENKQDEQMIAVNITIDCTTILDNMDKLAQGYKESGIIPNDGMILKPVTLKIKKDSTVLEFLQKVSDKYGLTLKVRKSPYGAYIESINEVAEKICGRTSGWMYNINGNYPGEGVSSYRLKEGDVIKFRYTCQPGDLK